MSEPIGARAARLLEGADGTVALSDLDVATRPCTDTEWAAMHDGMGLAPRWTEVLERVSGLRRDSAHEMARALVATAGSYIPDVELRHRVEQAMLRTAGLDEEGR